MVMYSVHHSESRHSRNLSLIHISYMNAELTPQTRKVLDLRFRQRLKYREIATELGISEVAVYKHLAQGIRKLKQKFNP